MRIGTLNATQLHRGLAVLLLLCLGMQGRDLAAQGVLINEASTGNPDWVEIANFGTEVVDLGAWRVESSFGFSSYPTFTFPAGQLLAPGDTLILMEMTSNFTPTSAPPASTPIIHTGFGWGWVGNSTGLIALFDSQNQLADLLVFGGNGVLYPAGCNPTNFVNPIDRSQNPVQGNDTIARVTTLDTDNGQDFVQTADANISPGLLNPGQTLGSLDIREFILAERADFSLVEASLSFSVTVTIAGFVTASGAHVIAPGADSIIGGTLVITGQYTPGDQDLEGFALYPGTLHITTVDGSDGMIIPNVWIPDEDLSFDFGGSVGATPETFRIMRTLGPVVSIRQGNSSQVLTALESSLASSDFVLELLAAADGPKLCSAGLDVAPHPQGYRAALGTPSAGQVELGIIGAPNSDLYHIFVVNPPYAEGTGPVAGISFGQMQYDMVLSPLGTEPYRVLPDARGRYHYQTPAGILPPGMMLDFLPVRVQGGLIFTLPPQRFVIP